MNSQFRVGRSVPPEVPAIFSSISRPAPGSPSHLPVGLRCIHQGLMTGLGRNQWQNCSWRATQFVANCQAIGRPGPEPSASRPTSWCHSRHRGVLDTAPDANPLLQLPRNSIPADLHWTIAAFVRAACVNRLGCQTRPPLPVTLSAGPYASGNPSSRGPSRWEVRVDS